MKKCFLFSLLLTTLLCLYNITEAQTKSKLVVFGHLVVSPPVGDFAADIEYGIPSYKTGIGVDGGVGLAFGKAEVLGTVGLTGFAAKEGNPYGAITYIPIKVGVKYFIVPNVFAAGDIGLGLLKDQTSSLDSRFARDIGVGFTSGLFEFAVYYDGWQRQNNSGSSNFISLKAGISLFPGLSK